MIQNFTTQIEDLEFRLDRARRRDMQDLTSNLKKELVERRYKFLVALTKRKELHTEDTYAQKARRKKVNELIEEQNEALDNLDSDEGYRLSDLI